MSGLAKGFAELVTDRGTVLWETFTCCHCNRQFRREKTEHGSYEGLEVAALSPGAAIAMCHACWKPVCPRCHAHGRCIPFEKRLARIESRASILKAAGIGA